MQVFESVFSFLSLFFESAKYAGLLYFNGEIDRHNLYIVPESKFWGMGYKFN